uniref:ALG13 UDP-N-acetylglucosaminyltransferase subunit n=1 Tax=Amazona collaria TaxID=241587 RepID=A0A8B9GD51_9PSIT
MFAGRQYYLGDKCQVRLEPGGKYYNAYIQEVGEDGNTLTVFVEELAEKHAVPLTDLKPVTQVAPVRAWNVVSSRKGGTYQKMGGYFSGIEMDVKTRKKLPKKIRGKEVFVTVSYSRGQAVLPPRLQHDGPSGHSAPLHCSQGGENMPPYDTYHPQRHNRGFGMSRGSARFINRHNMVVPQIAFYPSPGKRSYQSYDSFSCRSCSYSRSCRRMPCVSKECQYGFVPGNGEQPQGPEETITFCEIEGEDNTAFPALPLPYTSCLLSTLTLFQVMVNSAAISASTAVYAAPATGFSSNSAASIPASATAAVPPQTAVQPVVVSPSSIGRPVSLVPLPIYSAPPPPVSEVGGAGAVLPPYSCDPSGSDLVCGCMTDLVSFFLFSKYYHQSYWPPMMYVEPVLPLSPVEVHPSYTEPARALDQSVPLLYTDTGRTEIHQVPLEAPADEAPALSYWSVYYPVMSDPFSQQSVPGFDSLVPAYPYVSTWHPANPPYGNSPQIANAVSPGSMQQVSYIASPNTAPHDMPQGM